MNVNRFALPLSRFHAVPLLAFVALVMLHPSRVSAESAVAHEGHSHIRFGALDIDFGRDASGSELPGYPVASVSYIHQFESDFDSLPGKVSSHDVSLWAPVAPVDFGSFHILAMLGYRFTDFDTSVTSALPTESLHAIRLPVVFFDDRVEGWLLGGMVMPAVAGDLSSDDGFYLSAALGAGRQIRENLRVFGGVYYGTGFGEDTIIPGIALTWRPHPRWEVYLLGPISGIACSINDAWTVSLTARYDSPTWNVEADSNGPDRDLEVTALRVGLKLEGRLHEHLWGFITVGASLAREMEIETTSDRSILDDDIEAGPFVRTGLHLHF